MSEFRVTRSVRIDAPSARVHPLIDDFHAWREWSPWEGLDPQLDRRYEGGPGVGAHYAWQGNRRAGAGAMRITSSTPHRLDLDLEFTRPWKAHNRIRFDLEPVDERGEATDVTWTMTGTNSGVAAVFAKVFSMDRLLGKDFEKGLAALKRVAEKQHGAR